MDKPVYAVMYVIGGMCGCIPCIGTEGRGRLRSRLQIEGDCWSDLMIHCFAHPCALCQEDAEIKLFQAGKREAQVLDPVAAAAVVVPGRPAQPVLQP
eukprot:SAG22_NODE_1611_length_4001_cov_1.991287_4_plen_97_part_00